MNDVIGDLADQWDKLMAAGNATDRDSTLAFGDLIKAYCQSHRSYHTPDHIAALFSLADPLTFDDPASVKMAILYHDIVYDTDPQALQEMQQQVRSGNEERSAQRAVADMTLLGFPAETIARTARMIRLTATHQLEPQDSRDAALFLDMDMSILGAQPRAYGLYVSQVFSEYAAHGKEAVTKGRLDFIETTLKSPKIFHTDIFTRRYDGQARANLVREQIALSSGGGLTMLVKLTQAATMPPAPGLH
jgi:predicted metal-dependent HD superfamily phosphohydrolase